MPKHYLHHPIDIPILLRTAKNRRSRGQKSSVFSPGGLSCLWERYIPPGLSIDIYFKHLPSTLTASGQVIWCRKQQSRFLLGIGFDDPEQAYSVRMMEQVCQIESYRLQQQRNGRSLNHEQAAIEWIRLHAADFPPISCNPL